MHIFAVYFNRKPITFLWAIKKWAEKMMWWNADKREVTFLSRSKNIPQKWTWEAFIPVFPKKILAKKLSPLFFEVAIKLKTDAN